MTPNPCLIASCAFCRGLGLLGLLQADFPSLAETVVPKHPAKALVAAKKGSLTTQTTTALRPAVPKRPAQTLTTASSSSTSPPPPAQSPIPPAASPSLPSTTPEVSQASAGAGDQWQAKGKGKRPWWEAEDQAGPFGLHRSSCVRLHSRGTARSMPTSMLPAWHTKWTRRTALAAMQKRQTRQFLIHPRKTSLEFQQIVGKSVIKHQYSHVEVGHTLSDNLVAGTWKRAMNER